MNLWKCFFIQNELFFGHADGRSSSSSLARPVPPSGKDGVKSHNHQARMRECIDGVSQNLDEDIYGP